MRLGIIDCGTNTFHALVVDTDERGGFRRVFKERRYVRLGQEGLSQIGAAPFQRGVACMADFQGIMAQLGVERIRAFGTEALRRASNGRSFVEAVERETGLTIQLISGDEEARLIHNGVVRAVPPVEGTALIMDIGGGSVEFILTREKELLWARSFPIGVQVLFSKFHTKDPLTQQNLLDLEAYLEEMTATLSDILLTHHTPTLIGASGSFEVVENLLFGPSDDALHTFVPMEHYHPISEKIIRSSLADRHAMERLEPERAELIVVAFALINFIVKKAGIRQIITSAYAMKEGILFDLMEEG